ncbi:hypothetical protein CH373_13715 [Leptospira perolatii]|uniref:Uncharacterized protein n=1 Tax=Leptospira perolatii TaxID=2023191 RepID=A0A2M9ZK93_9LEPT|nr:hypothetical protein [Leptospira perolatii]PJZ69334.1 hypothetical protein CH360_11280 [Leptospira perolatii]PJZ72469.1 hypothetical protein CH373_13715 [Leptospira perolatii]
MILLKYFFLWFVLLFFAFVNAFLRELTYKETFGEMVSHQISVFTGIAIIGIPIWFISKTWPYKNSSQAIQVGVLWAIMTEMFEVSMMVFSQGKSVMDFLYVHNIFAGQFWGLIILWVAIAPYLFYKKMKSKSGA